MKKIILALCMTLVIFTSSTNISFAAAGCVHDFSACKNVGGTVNDLGYHQYLYGYDEYHSPIYKSCHLTQVVEYCVYVCSHCGLERSGSGHSHIRNTEHSVSH